MNVYIVLKGVIGKNGVIKGVYATKYIAEVRKEHLEGLPDFKKFDEVVIQKWAVQNSTVDGAGKRRKP